MGLEHCSMFTLALTSAHEMPRAVPLNVTVSPVFKHCLVRFRKPFSLHSKLIKDDESCLENQINCYTAPAVYFRPTSKVSVVPPCCCKQGLLLTERLQVVHSCIPSYTRCAYNFLFVFEISQLQQDSLYHVMQGQVQRLDMTNQVSSLGDGHFFVTTFGQ